MSRLNNKPIETSTSSPPSMTSTRNNPDLQRSLTLPADQGLGHQINIYCHTVIIERPMSMPTNPAHPSPPTPLRGVWVRSGGILDFMRTLFQNILDRDPENQDVLEYWTRNTYTHGLANTICGFFTSDEYVARGMSTEETVEKFYLAVFGRPALESERLVWMNKVREGTPLLTMAAAFIGDKDYRRMVDLGTAPDPVHWPY